MNEKKRLLKNTGLIALGNSGTKVISFLLLPLYTSILKTTEYGNYDFIVTIGAFLLPIITFSMHEAMFRFIIDSNDNDDFGMIINHAMVLVLFGVVVLTILIITIGVIFQIEYWYYILLYLISIVMQTFSNSILRGMGLMKQYAIISSIKNCLQLILNVIMIVVLRMGLHGLLCALCFSEFLGFCFVGFQIKIWNYIKFRDLHKSKFQEMLSYSLPLIPNSLCATIINLSDRIIIKNWLGSAANGVYTISCKFPSIIETNYHYFYNAWSESASKYLKEGKEKAETFYKSLYVQLDNLVFSVVLMLVSAMPILFRIFIRGEYVQGFDYVPFLMFAIYFDCIAKFYSGIFTALKKTPIIAQSTIIAAIVNIAMNICFIKKFGIYAAAISTLFADAVLVIIRKRVAQKEIEFDHRLSCTLLKIAVAVLIFVLYDYNSGVKTALSMMIAIAYTLVFNRAMIQSMFNILLKKVQIRWFT